MAQAYKVDFTTRTITITAEFERAMSNPEASSNVFYHLLKKRNENQSSFFNSYAIYSIGVLL